MRHPVPLLSNAVCNVFMYQAAAAAAAVVVVAVCYVKTCKALVSYCYFIYQKQS